MSVHPNFQMRIDTLVNLLPRGILAKGKVEGSELHVGDAVRVGNSPMGKTAIVTLITVKDHAVKQAALGSEATLLLTGLTSEDIHTGDVLSPGRVEEISRPDENLPWEKAEERIYPLRRSPEMFRGLFSLLIPLISLLFPVLIFIPVLNGRTRFENPLVFLLIIVWYVGIGYALFKRYQKINQSVRGWKIFSAGSGASLARILGRQVIERSDRYGSVSYTYQLLLEFEPMMAQPSVGTQRYEATVKEPIYQALYESQTVNLTYAIQNPRIFLLEGE